jgi:hypothetical protein
MYYLMCAIDEKNVNGAGERGCAALGDRVPQQVQAEVKDERSLLVCKTNPRLGN